MPIPHPDGDYATTVMYSVPDDDDDFPHVLEKVRAAVPEADLSAVLAAAFGRKPDGTTADHRCCADLS